MNHLFRIVSATAVCAVALFFAACKNEAPANSEAAAPASTSATPAATLPGWIGKYGGDFGGSNIDFFLEKAEGGNVSGHTEHKGQKTPFSGTATLQGSGYKVALNEPEADAYSGTFDATLDTMKSELYGVWMPHDTTKLGKITFKLTKVK